MDVGRSRRDAAARPLPAPPLADRDPARRDVALTRAPALNSRPKTEAMDPMALAYAQG